MLFGLGPAAPGSPPEARAAALHSSLAPGLAALRWGRQVHGARVVSVEYRPERGEAEPACVGPCDGLVAGARGLGLMVWTADCVPVLMAGDGAVAAVHAGWRGCAADIVGVALRALRAEHGVAAESLDVALGPAISGPAYAVGPEVVDALGHLGTGPGGWHDGGRIDLRAFLAARLAVLGVAPQRIERVGPCTASTPGLASFRRDGGAAGRQWSLLYRPL
jgi:YfiH family protein